MLLSPAARTHRRRGAMISSALALYVLVALGSAFTHHDLACHLKSRAHCTSCAFGLTTAGAEANSGFRGLTLPEARLTVLPLVTCPAAPVRTCTNDRSPPLGA